MKEMYESKDCKEELFCKPTCKGEWDHKPFYKDDDKCNDYCEEPVYGKDKCKPTCKGEWDHKPFCKDDDKCNDYCEEPVYEKDKGKDKCKPTSVDALIDKVIFKKFEKELLKNTIKVWKKVKCVNCCKVEVADSNVEVCAEKNAWIVSICYKVIINYTTIWGYEHAIIKTFNYEKVIHFPLVKPDSCDGPYIVDFLKAKPYLFIQEIQCKDVGFENCECDSIIKICILLAYEVIVTLKKEFCVLTDKDCKDCR